MKQALPGLARLTSPQLINLLTNLISEVDNLPRLELPHFAVQVNKSEVINLLMKFITEVSHHPKAY